VTQQLVIVGAAGHVDYVLDEVAAYPQIRFCACAPSYPGEDIRRYARGEGLAPRYYDDWRAMLDAERPHIVMAVGRYDTNAPIAIEAVRRGCHVIAEKPAAQRLDDLATLRELVLDHGVVYASLLNMRYLPTFYTAHALVREGIIGMPLLISGQKSYRWGASRPEWYSDRTAYGSTMIWVGIHCFDYGSWIAGVRYSEVFAYHANLAHPERPGCQDVATVIAKLDNGGSAVYHLDFLRPAAARTHGDEPLRVAGTRGVLEVCDQTERLHVITADQEVLAWPLRTPPRTLFGDIVAAIEGRGELLAPADEAFDATAFAIRAAEAADTGRVLQV
jgi:predicted dehydrogenase